jgi:DNA repair protein RecO (recombination protein O)
MQVQTKAIVLSSLKYGDSSLIVKCYTQKSGIKSYLLRSVLKSKKGSLKPAYFQPLTQLELVASHANKGSLGSIKEARIVYAYESLYADFIKQAIVFFVAEMLVISVQEEEENKDLFTYLETSLKWLDLHKKVSNFHLIFFINLTRYLGFYPDGTGSNCNAFNLQDGVFTNEAFLGPSLQGEDLDLFKSALGIKFDIAHELSLSVDSRQRLLEIIIEYYKLHLVSFRKPKSIEVLKNLFN